MSQTWTDDVFALSHEGETDLQNIENNLQCLKSLFSGTGFGLSPIPGMPWFDTSEYLLKIRNGANNDWMGVLALHKEGTNGLIWFHGNNLSNQQGWLIDTSITEDRVMALKNHGSGTYTTGRAVAGSWTITGLAVPTHAAHGHSHNHQWLNFTAAGSDDQTYNSGGSLVTLPNTTKNLGQLRFLLVHRTQVDAGDSYALNDSYTDLDATTDVSLTHSTPSHNGLWRTRAQVGIVIYPNIV